MTYISGTQGTGSLVGKVKAKGGKPKIRGGPPASDLAKNAAAAAKDYVRKGGDPPEALVEQIARQVEAKNGGKKLDPQKLRDNIRQGLAQTAARDDAKDLTDAQLEALADQGLNLAVTFSMKGPSPNGM
jgi:hypothetical protein